MKPPEILEAAAETYRERNAVYKDNFRNNARVMQALFPDGIPEMLNEQDLCVFDLFHMVIGKMSRFANSNMTHVDSMHDIVVYAAMIESVLKEE